MNNSGNTLIHFDYGGFYSYDGDDVRWNRKEPQIYNLLIRSCLEEVTYDKLVERLRRRLDEATTELMCSYVPLLVNPKRQIYIEDDEGLMMYLLDVDKNHCRSVMHVELTDGVVRNQSLGQFSRIDRGSGVDVARVEVGSNAKATENRECEQPEEHLELDIVPHNVADVNLDDIERTYVIPLDEVGFYGLEDVLPSNEVAYVEWEDGIGIELRQEFESKQAVKDLVERVVHRNCFDFVTVKSTTTLYVLKCREGDCKWYLRVAKVNGSNCFSVRTYEKMHTCSRASTSINKHKRKGTPHIVASVVRGDFPGQFNTPPPKSIVGMVQGKIGVKVSYTTTWRGKKLAGIEVRGSPKESFMSLPSYLHMLERLNPGTVTRLQVDDEQKFKYLFFALGACIDGFKCMRKVIIVDGTHINTCYGGVLIIASAQDPNRHNYPLAFGVVDGEKDASWRWFLETLKLVIPDDPEIVFVSDRNASIIKTIGEVYPMAKHGYCIWHLSQNVKKKVGGGKEAVAKQFRECAHAYMESEFIRLYDDFRGRYPKGAEYLDVSVDVSKWAKCKFPGERFNIDTTNCVESTNNVFSDARKYSLLPMLDVIVAKICEWFNKHRKSAAEVPESQRLVPRVLGEFHGRCEDAVLLKVCELNSFFLEYNVIGTDGKSYLVDLRRKTCSCKCFDIDRYPCVHAIAANTQYAKIPVHELCSKYFLIEQWTLAYSRTIFTVPHKDDWIIPDEVKDQCVLPPDYIKKLGRQRTRRYLSVGEKRGKANSGGGKAKSRRIV